MAIFGDGTKYGSGALYGAVLIRGSVSASSSCISLAKDLRKVVGVVSSEVSCSGSVLNVLHVSGSINCQSNCSALLSLTKNISGSISCLSSLSSSTKKYQRVRFYFPSTGTAPISPSVSSSWDATISGFTRKSCVTTKINSAFSYLGTSSNSSKVAFVQYISDKLAPQTLYGKVRGFLQARENSSAYDCCPAIVIRVVSENGSVVRGTLLSAIPTSLSDEFYADTSVCKNNFFPREQIINQVECQENDRLVIEIGRKSFTGYYAINSLCIGDNASDLPENNTETSVYSPWLEFDSPLYFANEKHATGTLSCQSSVSGGLEAIKKIFGSIENYSNFSSRALLLRFISGSFNSECNTVGNITTSSNLVGKISAISSIYGNMFAIWGSSGTINGLANTSTLSHVFRLIDGFLDATSSLFSRCSFLLKTSGSIYCQSYLVSNIIRNIKLRQIINAQSYLYSSALIDLKISGSINASMLSFSDAFVNYSAKGNIDSYGSIIGRIIKPTKVIGIIESESYLSSIASALKHIYGSIVGTSQNAVIPKRSILSSGHIFSLLSSHPSASVLRKILSATSGGSFFSGRIICPRKVQGDIEAISFSNSIPSVLSLLSGMINSNSLLNGSTIAHKKITALLRGRSLLSVYPRANLKVAGDIDVKSDLVVFPYYIVSPFTGEIVMFFDMHDVFDIIIQEDKYDIVIQEDKYDIKTDWRV